MTRESSCSRKLKGRTNEYINMKIRQELRKLRHVFKDRDHALSVAGGTPVRQSILATTSYRFTEHDISRVSDILRLGHLHHEQGQENARFETEFAVYTQTKYALTTNSGTSALDLAIQAIGVHKGDEVILPAYTFISCAQAILRHGGIPVFADIDDTCTISPKHIQKLITAKTRAVIVAHLFGNTANMQQICALARKYKLFIIEDCAQAVGATYNGKPVGSIGDIGCFSFNIKKAIPTGQGGMLVTNSDSMHLYAKAARNTGIVDTKHGTDVITMGGTYFMTEIEASLGRSILRQLEQLNTVRKNNFEYLMSLLSPLSGLVKPYRIQPSSSPVFSRLSFFIDFDLLGITRSSFLAAMQSEGIPLKAFYPTPLYKYSLFRKNVSNIFSKRQSSLYCTLQLPFVEVFSKQHVGMEFSPYWTTHDMRDIAKAFSKVIRLLNH